MDQLSIRGATAADIADSIERHARSAEHDERLPTIRELAATLHVSPVTVAAAYRLLHARGLAVGHGRRGTRLRPAPHTPHPSPPPPPLAARRSSPTSLQPPTRGPPSALKAPDCAHRRGMRARHTSGESADANQTLYRHDQGMSETRKRLNTN